MAKNDYIRASESGSGVSSIEISAKAMAAAQKTRRKNILYTSALVGVTLLSAITIFLSAVNVPVSGKSSHYLIAENADQAYFNEWPEEATAIPVSQSSFSKATIKPKPDQKAESMKVIPAVSERSILSFSEEKTVVSKDAADHIRTELMEMQSCRLPSANSPDLMRNLPIISVAGASKKDIDWYVGIGFNPQLSNYEIAKNAAKFNVNDGYAHTNYISSLKNQSKVYNYNASIKAGFVYKHKWMVQVSAGYQSFRYLDKENAAAVTPFVSGAMVSKNAIAANTYNYVNFSMEASRIFEFKNVGLKTGLSFSAARLASANSVVADGQHLFLFKKHHHGAPLSKWIYAPGIHVGLVKNLSGRVQMQASPNFYYNLNSMFNRNYIVTQKPYGVGLDLSLMIRIN